MRIATIIDKGLLEFKSTIIKDFILAFCDSQFIAKYDYLEMLSQLIEIFYYYWSKVDEGVSDMYIEFDLGIIQLIINFYCLFSHFC